MRDNILITRIKILRLNLTSKSEQIENIGQNIFIKGSLFMTFDPLHRIKIGSQGLRVASSVGRK